MFACNKHDTSQLKLENYLRNFHLSLVNSNTMEGMQKF